MRGIITRSIIIECLSLGMTYSDIGRRYRVSTSSVSQLAKKWGLRIYREAYLQQKRDEYEANING